MRPPHMMEAVIFWWPAYRLAGINKLLTAAVSWATVVALVSIVPVALAMCSPKELVPDPAKAKEQLKLLWLSCGNKDGPINISQGMQRYLKEKGVPHSWNVDSHGHDPTHWRNNLYHFAQFLFKESSSGQAKGTETAGATTEGTAPANQQQSSKTPQGITDDFAPVDPLR